MAGDLYQMRELCRTLEGLVVAPLEGAASGSTWRECEKDVSKIFEQLKYRLKDPAGKVPPIQHEPGYDPMRYFAGGYRASECSVGIASRFADLGGPPFWLRYSKYTPDFGRYRRQRDNSQQANFLITWVFSRVWVGGSVQ